jgi:hypothetical protein
MPGEVYQCAENMTSYRIAVPRNLQANVSYMCITGSSTVVWQLGGCNTAGESNILNYLMVDRDEFITDEVLIQDGTDGTSLITLSHDAREFLSGQLQSDLLTLQCGAVVDDLNVYGGEVVSLEFYGTPSPAEDLSLYLSSDSSVFLQWRRPECMGELVLLSYRVTASRTSDSQVVFEEETTDTSMEVDLADVNCDEPLLLSVVTINNCTGSSEPATLTSTIPPRFEAEEIRDSLEVAVNLSSVPDICVTLYFDHVSIACTDRATEGSGDPCNSYTYTATTLEGNVTESASTCMESAGLWIQLCSPLFEPSTLYEVSLSACDEAVGVCQDITSIPISTAQLQGASIEFIDSIAKLTCFYVENIPLTNDTCDFTFFFLDGSELLFSIPRNSASNSALFETPNTRWRFSSDPSYLFFVVVYHKH